MYRFQLCHFHPLVIQITAFQALPLRRILARLACCLFSFIVSPVTTGEQAWNKSKKGGKEVKLLSGRDISFKRVQRVGVVPDTSFHSREKRQELTSANEARY